MKEGMTPQEQESYELMKQKLNLPDEEIYTEYYNNLDKAWQDKEMTLDEKIEIIDFIKNNPLPKDVLITAETRIMNLRYKDFINEAVKKGTSGAFSIRIRGRTLDDLTDHYKSRLEKTDNKENEIFEIFKENYEKDGCVSLYERMALNKAAKEFEIDKEHVFVADWNGALSAYWQRKEIEEVIS